MLKVPLVILVLGVLWEGTYGADQNLLAQMNAMAAKVKKHLDFFENRVQRLEAEVAQLTNSNKNGPIVDCVRYTHEMHTTKKPHNHKTLTYNDCPVDTSNGGMNKHNGVFTVPVGQGGIYQMSLSMKFQTKGVGSIACQILVNNKPLSQVQSYNLVPTMSSHVTPATLVYYKLRTGDRAYVTCHGDKPTFIYGPGSSNHFTLRKVL